MRDAVFQFPRSVKEAADTAGPAAKVAKMSPANGEKPKAKKSPNGAKPKAKNVKKGGSYMHFKAKKQMEKKKAERAAKKTDA